MATCDACPLLQEMVKETKNDVTQIKKDIQDIKAALTPKTKPGDDAEITASVKFGGDATWKAAVLKIAQIILLLLAGAGSYTLVKPDAPQVQIGAGAGETTTTTTVAP